MAKLVHSNILRFIGYIAADLTTGCWNWLGDKDPKGYGKFWWADQTGRAHRFAYIFFHGEIPEGLEPDHLCRNTSCVNPEHLEAVTRRINLIRGNSPVGFNARKMHCKRGHLFDKANTRIQIRKGYEQRKCKKCDCLRQKNYYQRKNAKAD